MEGTTIISTSSVVASQKDVRASIASEIDDLMEDLFAPKYKRAVRDTAAAESAASHTPDILMEDLFAPKYKRAVCDTAAAESAASHTPDTMSPASGIGIDGPEHSPFHSSPNTPAGIPFSASPPDFDDGVEF